MLKIRRPLERLIFNMGIAIPGKTVFLIETAPRTYIMVFRFTNSVNSSTNKIIHGSLHHARVISRVMFIHQPEAPTCSSRYGHHNLYASTWAHTLNLFLFCHHIVRRKCDTIGWQLKLLLILLELLWIGTRHVILKYLEIWARVFDCFATWYMWHIWNKI